MNILVSNYCNIRFHKFLTCRFHVLENGSLMIEEVHLSDEGKYGCTAGNSGGLKRYEVSLIVRSKFVVGFVWFLTNLV